MSDWNINIELLIHKYASGTLNDNEALYLAEWVNSSAHNAALFRKMLRNIENTKMQPTPQAEKFCNKALAQIFPQPSKRVLPTPHFSRAKWGAIISGIAATVVILLAIPLAIWSKDAAYDAEASSAIVLNEEVRLTPEVCYTAPQNETKLLSLADGTSITLNQGTELIVCEGYNSTQRRVILNGEAYFNVAKGAKQFVVSAGNKEYIVHGTSFNILSFKGDNFAIVTLHSGSLEAKVDSESYMLTPGEELQIDDSANSISKRVVDTSVSTGWMSKQLKFSCLPLKFVAKQLSHKYNTKINIHRSIEDIPYTGQLLNEDIATALKLLSITSPVNLAITNLDGEYYISRKN